ncbi:MAG: hypothetical protein DI597_17085 [Pseudoxanthomonas spadix]|nr:MAG: hypothetical protein DI597_17085 [Pseudoxanthomonas spadix]
MDGVLQLLSKLRRVLASRGRAGDEIDDLMQEAFLRLQLYCRERTVHNTEAFLVRTVLNLSAEQGRKSPAHRMVLDQTVAESLPDPSPPPDELYVRQERAQRMKTGLERLNPRPREVLLLHRLDGLSHAQIAERLGISVSMVEKHIARASFFLRDWMARSPE